MNSIKLKARAKINLYLDVLNKRKDNYHNIKSIFQKIDLYDDLSIEKTDSNNIELICNIDSLNNEDNIIYKAYVKLKDKYNIGGVKVILNKRIPMQAGLAGGSTDCASFILGINKLFDLKLSKEELESIGSSLGADVVPCLYDGAVLAEGIGDIITPINTNFKYYIVLVKPKITCNTKEMYRLIDEANAGIELDLSYNVIKGLETNDIELISNNLLNVFENVQEDKLLINNIKLELLNNGAIGSLLTGSGSCIYGLFKDEDSALKAFNKLKKSNEVYICTSYNSGSGEND